MNLHQMTLDELHRSRRNDPETSKDAARRARGIASEHQRRILEVLRRGGDWTPEEIASVAGLESLQVSRRIAEMARDGSIELSGATRPTATGCSARCWRLANG